jgi:hypothetical protein
MSTGEPDATEIGHVRFGGGPSEKDQVNWHLVGGLSYRTRWFGRRALEKDLPSRHLASVLPHFIGRIADRGEHPRPLHGACRMSQIRPARGCGRNWSLGRRWPLQFRVLVERRGCAAAPLVAFEP